MEEFIADDGELEEAIADTEKMNVRNPSFDGVYCNTYSFSQQQKSTCFRIPEKGLALRGFHIDYRHPNPTQTLNSYAQSHELTKS